MKNIYLLIFYLGIIVLASCKSERTAEITVKLEGYLDSTQVYCVIGHSESLLMAYNPDTLYADDNGKLLISINISEPKVFALYSEQENGIYYCDHLYVKPGESHSVTINLMKDFGEDDNWFVEGPNSEGQMLLSRVDDGWRGQGIFDDKWELSKPETLMDSLTDKIKNTLEPFTELYNNHSIDELISILPNKPIFIDCWATWCGPCINQLQYAGSLNDFLQKKDITKVYIAFERQPDREKWEQYIKKHNLIGNHIMINESLRKSILEKLEIDRIGLPRYILLNSKGEILISNALFPSTGEELYKQIEANI